MHAYLLVQAVEVLHVVHIQVGGGDVRATPKPPLPWDAIPLLRLKVPAGHTTNPWTGRP